MIRYQNSLVKCVICGKVLRGRIPAGGDGSVLFPRLHNDVAGICQGSYTEGQEFDYEFSENKRKVFNSSISNGK